MYNPNEQPELKDLKLKVSNTDDAFLLLKSLIGRELPLPLVSLRELSLELQLQTFYDWEIPYHVDRKGHCHITDLECVCLALYAKASIELSATLLKDPSTTVMIIGNAVVVERSSQPGEVLLLVVEGVDG